MSGLGGFSPRIKGLALVAAALGVLALVGAPRPEPPRRTAWQLPAFAAWQRFSLTQTGAPAVVAERTPAGWTVAGTPLEPGAERLLAELFGEPVGADVAEAVADVPLERFGLTEDALTVTVEGPGGPLRFRVGKSVDARRTFVLPADGTHVLRARAGLRRAFDRPPEAWRDRRVFPGLTYADVRRLSLTRGGRPDWAVTRSAPDAPWQAADGGAVEAETVAGIVNTFTTLQADPGPSEGFSPSLRFEGEAFDGRVLVLDYEPARPSPRIRRPSGQVALLASHLAGFLDLPAAGLVDRRLFPGAATAQGLVIGGDLRLERGPAGWTLDGTVLPASGQAAVQALLDARAAGVAPQVPPDAFARPLHTVVLRGADDAQHAVTLGAEFRAGARFARTGDAHTFVLSPATVEALMPTRATLTAP